MLELFCRFIDKLGDVPDEGERDEGVGSVLNQAAFDALKDIVVSLYGDHAGEVFENSWEEQDDGGMVVSQDSEAFRLCFTGRG